MSHIRQIFSLEVATLIGLDAQGGATALRSHLYGDVGHARSVVEAHIALQESSVLAGTCRHLCLGVALALTVARGTNLIFIVLQGRYGFVLIAELVDTGFHFFPCAIVGSLRSAQHGEEVNGIAVGLPDEQYATLSCLSLQRWVYLTDALVMEGGQRGGRIAFRRVGELRRDGYNGIAFLLPSATECSQQFVCCLYFHFLFGVVAIIDSNGHGFAARQLPLAA